MEARATARLAWSLLLGAVSAMAQAPATPNLSPEFPVPSTLPDTMRPAPRPYDCTLARGLGDCTETPGPPPAVQGAPLPPPRRLPPAAGDPDAAAPTAPGVPPPP